MQTSAKMFAKTYVMMIMVNAIMAIFSIKVQKQKTFSLYDLPLIDRTLLT